MSQTVVTFRSKAERERETQLVRNYREIGIAAIAAASQACCKDRRDRKSNADQPAISLKRAARD